MTPQGRKHKVSHPGYGKVEGFNHRMDWVFAERIEDLYKGKQTTARRKYKEAQKTLHV